MIEVSYPEFKKIPNYDYKISIDKRVYSIKSKRFIQVDEVNGRFLIKDSNGKTKSMMAWLVIVKLFKKELQIKTLERYKKLGINNIWVKKPSKEIKLKYPEFCKKYARSTNKF